MTELSKAERAQRNADYFRKVFGSEDLKSVRNSVEEAMSGVESVGPADGGRHPLESLDVLGADPTGSALTMQDFDRLEAIIFAVGRPAYIIDNGSFAADGPWAALATGVARQKIEAAIPSVGRVEVPRDFRPYAGTGFVVGENLLMTNRHVARIFCSGIGTKMLKFDPGQIAGIDFLRELPLAGKPDPVFLEISDIVMIHPYWDMALLKTKQPLPDKHPPLKLSTTSPQDLASRTVVVIGYPAKDPRNNEKVQESIFGGRYKIKRLMPGEHGGAVNYHGQDVMAHDTSTLGGASGSPVLDVESGEIVGLHFAGEYMMSNYAVPTIHMAEDSRIVDAGVNFSGTRPPQAAFYQPLWEKVDRNEIVDLDLSEAANADEGSPPPAVDPLLPRFSFESLSNTDFDWTAALSTALASHIVYFDEPVIKEACDSWGLEQCHFVSHDDTECFVAGDGSLAIVAFRGTEKKIADWLTDLNSIGTTQSYGRVHRGFWGAFQGVAQKLEEKISDLGSPTLVLTGHSLGGALSVIAAAEWIEKYNVQSVYTFGQPAVGRGHFPDFMRENFDHRFFRFVNDDDIVPKVPPFYRHTGQLFHFGPGNDLQHRTESLFGEETPTMSQEQFDQLRIELLRRRMETENGTPGTQEGWFPSFQRPQPRTLHRKNGRKRRVSSMSLTDEDLDRFEEQFLWYVEAQPATGDPLQGTAIRIRIKGPNDPSPVNYLLTCTRRLWL
ncbi:MAG: trypsin-like peptidase domain-containing protein [Planctomycetaceae bacterium]